MISLHVSNTVTGGNLHQSVNQNLHLSPAYVKPCDNRTLMDVDHDELDVSPVNIISNSAQVEEVCQFKIPMVELSIYIISG